MVKQSDEFDILYPAKNDMAPPWEMFPTYTLYSVGWRMGDGESYKYDWQDFVDSLPSDFKFRLKYLQRNRPAPINHFYKVLWVLYPNDTEDKEYQYKNSQAEIPKLLELGLIKHDVAFETWLQQQTEICFPWTLSETPEEMTRYWTRQFWFFSRHFNNNRNIKIPKIPDKWKDIEYSLMSRKIGDIDPSKGLLTISKMFCAANILTPWQLGLTPDDYHDSFEMDMGYADAYRLWLISAFDDDKLIREMLTKIGIPEEWNGWIEEQIKSISF